MPLRATLWVLLSLLAGCVTSTPPSSSAEGWPLLPPATLGRARQVMQVLRGDYADHSFTLRSMVSVTDQQLSVVGLSSMGMRLFTLNYDGVKLSEERVPQVPETLQARQLLNDLQLAFWPLPALQQAWQASGGQVSEPYPGTRRLHRDGVLLAEVHIADDAWQGRVWLRHFDYPYSLYIDTIPVESSGP